MNKEQECARCGIMILCERRPDAPPIFCPVCEHVAEMIEKALPFIEEGSVKKRWLSKGDAAAPDVDLDDPYLTATRADLIKRIKELEAEVGASQLILGYAGLRIERRKDGPGLQLVALDGQAGLQPRDTELPEERRGG